MHDFAAHKTMTTFTQPASTPMVLVVEDEPGIAGVLSAYLERDGLRIRMAQDGEEALQSFRQLRPDLVLLDIHLPKVDGVDVLRMIRNDSDVPVIMVTALADDVDKLLALRLGRGRLCGQAFQPSRSGGPGACRAAPHPGQACAGGRAHTRRPHRDRRGSP